ncbi:hypothetical protein AC578_1475 [Pseudocercospora eumusae]|uniref:Uncharacterized protein n=1 Tax=Pseudocercospora eumusae TaxID=321146 RepID=A0A139H6I4_9PEZI|nr:hypothetical protein AC578_1475 [Pseudocercospora eumusae]
MLRLIASSHFSSGIYHVKRNFISVFDDRDEAAAQDGCINGLQRPRRLKYFDTGASFGERDADAVESRRTSIQRTGEKDMTSSRQQH